MSRYSWAIAREADGGAKTTATPARARATPAAGSSVPRRRLFVAQYRVRDVGRFQRCDRFLIERQVNGGGEFLHLFDARRPHDRRIHSRHRKEPGERHLRRVFSKSGGTSIRVSSTLKSASS